MSPQLLRCEARRSGGCGIGLWRYSLAALIVCAAMIDALLLAPPRPRGPSSPEAREPAVSAEIYRCRR